VLTLTVNSDGKRFHADGPAAEELRGSKPTVFVLAVAAKSPRSASGRQMSKGRDFFYKIVQKVHIKLKVKCLAIAIDCTVY